MSFTVWTVSTPAALMRDESGADVVSEIAAKQHTEKINSESKQICCVGKHPLNKRNISKIYIN
jgi:hypothetical protein